MVTSGQARGYRSVHQNVNTQQVGPVKATSRPPGPRIGGGIRILRGGTGLSGSNKHLQEKNGQAEAGPLPLYRRMLYPGPADRAPQILQTPGCGQVDTELYNLLALVCRGFITPWYSKISKDRAFFLEIVRVASHVFRQLEARLEESDGNGHSEQAHRHVSPPAPQNIDKIRLMFDTLPSILERHIQDYHTAKERSKSAYSAGASAQDGLSSLEVYFHSLQPHSAITTHTSPHQASPERLPPTINADYIRAAIDALLEALMPNEDFQADTERSVVREVIVGIVLEGVFRKVAQPWFIYGLVAKLLEPRTSDKAVPPTMQQSFPTPTHNQAKTPISVTPQEWWARLASLAASLPIYFSQLVALFGYLSYLFTTSFASPYYKRYSKRQHLSDVIRPWTNLVLTAVSSGSASRQTLSQISRTAQAVATLASPLLDRIIVHYLYSRIFTATFTVKMLRIVEQSLFPDGFPAPAVPDPTPEEQVLLKERAIRALADCMPAEAVKLLVQDINEEDPRLALAEEVLEPFSSHYVNLHLYLFLLDTVVANIRPDLVVADEVP